MMKTVMRLVLRHAPVGSVALAGVVALAGEPGTPPDSAVPTEVGQTQNPLSANEASVSEGKALYLKNCVSCHGAAGAGDGPKAASLKVTPADLSNPDMLEETDKALYSKITNGKTPMPSFRSQLSQHEVWALIRYVRTLARRGSTQVPTGRVSKTEKPPAESGKGPLGEAQSGGKVNGTHSLQKPKAWVASAGVDRWKNPVAVNQSSISKGEALYEQECIVCHGPAGKGDGRKAKMLDVSPADLTDPKMRQETDGALCWKISEGKTPMPSFRMRFSRREVWHLVNYIRTLAPRASTAASEGEPSNKEVPGNSQGSPENHDQPSGANASDANGRKQLGEPDQPEKKLPVAKPEASGDTKEQSTRRRLLPPEYLHILINPLPVYGLGTAVLVLTAGFVLRNRPIRQLGLVLIVLMAASAWPVYWIGQKSYNRVYTLADNDGQTWLDAHKHRAERLIYVFYGLTAVATTAALVPVKATKTSFTLATLTLVLALASLGAAGWIAKAGGQVRHPEFRNEPDAARGQGGSE